MPVPEAEAEALRRCLPILARGAAPNERITMARSIDKRISGQETTALAFRFQQLAALFYPSDSTRAQTFEVALRTAREANDLVSLLPLGQGGVFLSDLAAWPNCPPIPADSPLKYWLPGMPVEKVQRSQQVGAVKPGARIEVAMSAPYLSLAILVSAIATAVARVNGHERDPREQSTAVAAAAFEWESKLRELANDQAIDGHDFETLAAQPWYLLDIERDVFYVNDLNACKPLADAGLRFEVVEDQDRSGDAAFLAGFVEQTNNGRDISWRYWVGQMPSLSAAEACRLLSGLDPDLYEDINARPVPANNVNEACKKAVMLERLAAREGKDRDSAAGWLEWARQREFVVHPGFILGVHEYQQPEGAGAVHVADEDAPTTSFAEFFLEARPESVPAALTQMDPAEKVLAHRHMAGRRTSYGVPAADVVEMIGDVMARQIKGRFTMEEAAEILAEANGLDAADFLKARMHPAFASGALILIDPKDGGPVVGRPCRDMDDWATPENLDKWLEATGFHFRWPTSPTTFAIEAVSRSAAQDRAIIAKLQELGFNPLSLPPYGPKSPGAKSDVRKALGTKGMWAGSRVFDKAWERLMTAGEIAYMA